MLQYRRTSHDASSVPPFNGLNHNRLGTFNEQEVRIRPDLYSSILARSVRVIRKSTDASRHAAPTCQNRVFRNGFERGVSAKKVVINLKRAEALYAPQLTQMKPKRAIHVDGQ
jgi:hypothetical protein